MAPVPPAAGVRTVASTSTAATAANAAASTADASVGSTHPHPPRPVPGRAAAAEPPLCGSSRACNAAPPPINTSPTGSGTVYFDVEVDPDRLGFHARVLLWMAVSPSRLARIGGALALHEEIVFAAATTGETNVVATVVCQDMPALHRYLTERVGVLDGVERVETAPLLRHVKQVGAVSF
ncbi:Lrp/AsnC family transcriptional regulator [Virgisporangium ochraceum]|uniref:Lrp/AsnC family transcriptional regulator n=1 Tax=Virgisporangium ochraceum TaxID=65505 RepID=UPI001EF32A25|nr:Lrp/AsnC family transcriptional regulator [Virgisporangium ochraceum]